MVLKHRGFLLDATGFQECVSPLLCSLDTGNAQPLFEQAIQVVEQNSPDLWPLELAGSALLNIRKVDSVGLPWKEPIEECLQDASTIRPFDLGYWLLLVFSKFVQQPTGIGVNYATFCAFLRNFLGWNVHETKLLVQGIPAVVLLKPNAASRSSVLKGDPYWYWMIPTHSYERGWLSQDQISMLYHKLIAQKQAVESFDYRRFTSRGPGFSYREPDERIDRVNRLHEAYGRAIEMLEDAQRTKKELYVVLSE